MKKRRTGDEMPLDPMFRICPEFDPTGLHLFPVADPGEKSVPVIDNCAEEHIM